jgi:Mg2+/citrate symporter
MDGNYWNARMSYDFIPQCIWTQCLPAFGLGVLVTFLWGTVLAARDRRRLANDAERRADSVRKIQSNKRKGN